MFPHTIAANSLSSRWPLWLPGISCRETAPPIAGCPDPATVADSLPTGVRPPMLAAAWSLTLALLFVHSWQRFHAHDSHLLVDDVLRSGFRRFGRHFARGRQVPGLYRHLYWREEPGHLRRGARSGNRQALAAGVGRRGEERFVLGRASRQEASVLGQRDQRFERQADRRRQRLCHRSGQRQADAHQPAVVRRGRPLPCDCRQVGADGAGGQLWRRQRGGFAGRR